MADTLSAETLRQINSLAPSAAINRSVEELSKSLTVSAADTSNQMAANFKPTVSDPIAATLASQKPEARTFVTSPYFLHQKEISFDTSSASSKELVSAYPKDKLRALAAAAGMKDITSDAELEYAINTASAGLKQDLAKGFKLDFDDSKSSALGEFSDNVSAKYKQLSAEISSAFSDVSGFASDVKDEVSKAFDAVYEEFPELTNAAGKAIKATTGMSLGRYNDIVRNANSLCPDLNLSRLVDWGRGQNLFATLLEMIMDSELGDLFRQMFDCKKYFDGPYQDRLKRQVINKIPYMAGRGNTGMVRTTVSRTNLFEFPDKRETARILTRKSSGTPRNKQDMDYIMTFTNTTVDDIFTTKGVSQRTAWDNSVISEANPYLSKAYVGEEVAMMGKNMPF